MIVLEPNRRMVLAGTAAIALTAATPGIAADGSGDLDTYHQRSLVETKMHCFKLLGQRVAARTFDRQKTELKVRTAILNRFSQIGTPNTVRAA